MSKRTEALKLALEALEESLGYVQEEAENAQRLYGQYPARQARIQGLKDDARKHMDAITAIREALAEQCVCGEPDTPGTHRTDGPCLAEQPACEHEWLRGACLKCGQSIEQPAQQGITCNKKLREQGKAYPRTCKKCGLGPCIADRVQPAPVASPHEQQEPVEYWTVADGWVSEQAEVPVAAWIYPEFWDHCKMVGCGTAYRLPGTGRHPLYTSPPASKPWVGLTDEDIDQGLLRSDYAFKTAEAWRAGVVFAMTKLKEKNT